MTEIATTNDIFIVHRRDITRSDFLSVAPVSPEPGEILLKIEKFGLTSNNVTYAALGDSLPYFKFFPIADNPRAEEWACPPVWGIGQIVASATPDLQEGAYVYGFFPAANYITIKPTAVTTSGFRVDRPGIPPSFGLYNLYSLNQGDPYYKADQEDLMVVLRPVFLTGLLLADYLEVSDFQQAEAVIISSAASKTSYGLAAALADKKRCEIIGLASANSQPSAEAMQVYDRVVRYDAITELSQNLTAVYVDIAGSVAVRDELADQLGAGLKLVLAVGMTHWQEGNYSFPQSNPAIKSEVFFAPGWAARRQKEVGGNFFSQLYSGWQAQMALAGQYFKVVPATGKTAVSQAFADVAQGRLKPEEALVLSLG